MSASIRIRSGCGARLRKAGKEAGWSNYFFFPDLPLLSKGNYKTTTRRKYSAFAHPKRGRFTFQFWPCLFVMHRWERRESIPGSLSNIGVLTNRNWWGGGGGGVRTITINSDGACLRKKPTLVLSLGTLWSLGQMVAHKGSTVMEASILCYKFLRIKVWQFSLQS